MASSETQKRCFCLLLALQLVALRSCYGGAPPPISAAHRLRTADTAFHLPETQQRLLPPPPLRFFEVAPPLDPPPPPLFRCASSLLLRHSFANTYNRPPIMTNYTPPSPSLCPSPASWDLVLLKWTGTCKGRQFDRISAVWFGGVEFFRTCTAEPTKQGIVWQVIKDVTRYSSLLADPQLVVLELGNIVDKTYTGVFHINLTLEFFSSHSTENAGHLRLHSHRPADLVLPISSPSPLPQGHWFQIPNDTDTAFRTFRVPSNVYRAVLEIYVSFHGNDEFWYTNPTNDYIIANNLTGIPGNGPFREVQAFLDAKLVGAVWPFPVIYTGGIDPLFWRPAAAIGAFNLPTYEFEMTPFVGSLVDGSEHTLSFKVMNATGFWLIDANLHLWLDHNSTHTYGQLVRYTSPAFSPIWRSHFTGMNGTFHTTATRFLSFSGFVVSSIGNVSVSSTYDLSFDNVLVFENNSNLQTVAHAVQTKGKILANTSSQVVYSQNASFSFPLSLRLVQTSGPNNSFTQTGDLRHSFNALISTFSISGSSLSSLRNSQHADGTITVANNLVTAGIGSLQQKYNLESSHGCYERSLSTKNYTILHDSSSTSCNARG